MATVTQSSTPSKAFRATEPEDCVWLCVLGEIGLSECQALMDRWHGGAAAIACGRQQEVL